MTDVARFYHDVIDDVINGVKDEWVEEGLDLQVLDELRKLWTTKLAESHVFDPEPTVNTAAQYLNLVQRSHTQLRPSGPTTTNSNVRPVAPAARVVIPNVTGTDLNRNVAIPGSLANIRPNPMAGLTTQFAQAVHPQRLAQHTIPQVAGAPIGTQLQARSLAPGVNPQLAALPSGLTGHLVQIGQQTYLVPQTLVGLRQPSVGSAQLPISHLVGTTTSAGQNLVASDPSAFQQTQVDGNHDNDGTTGSRNPGSIAGPSSARPTERGSDFEDDDDDDDDDFVAATPGFAPSSVRPHYPVHRDSTPADSAHLHHDVPSLMSAPQTPMTPSSVLSRTSFVDTPGWRRPNAARHPEGTPSGRKRRRRASGAGDTDTDDFDDDDEYDDDGYGVDEDVEVTTNASMTPAPAGIEHDDYDDARGRSPRLKPPKSKRPAAQTPTHPPSPTSSQLGDAPPETVEPSSADDHEGLQGDDDAEHEEDEEPLNSEDDVSDEEPEVLFESDNVVVCQYDKIHRSRNRWRFNLKDGIMAIHGRDHVFQKAVGEAEW